MLEPNTQGSFVSRGKYLQWIQTGIKRERTAENEVEYLCEDNPWFMLSVPGYRKLETAGKKRTHVVMRIQVVLKIWLHSSAAEQQNGERCVAQGAIPPITWLTQAESSVHIQTRETGWCCERWEKHINKPPSQNSAWTICSAPRLVQGLTLLVWSWTSLLCLWTWIQNSSPLPASLSQNNTCSSVSEI